MGTRNRTRVWRFGGAGPATERYPCMLLSMQLVLIPTLATWAESNKLVTALLIVTQNNLTLRTIDEAGDHGRTRTEHHTVDSGAALPNAHVAIIQVSP